jgi:TRAP transporter TAXI family solute receptor
MIRKFTHLAAFGAAAAIGLAATAPAHAQAKAVRLGTSSVGSVYYTLAVAMSKLLKDEVGLASTVEAVGGSTPNVIAIGANRVDIAITNAFASYNGYHGLGRFKKRGKVKLGLLVVGNPSLRQLVIRKGSGVKDIKDLAGKTIIGKRPALPEIAMITNAMLKVYGISPSKLRVIATTETGEAMDAIAANTVAGGVIPGSQGAGYFRRAARENKIEFFSFPKDKMDAMMKLLPEAFDTFEVKANTYDNQPKAYTAINMATTLIGSTQYLSEENGYKVMKAIFDHLDKFRTYHSAAKDWTLENTLAKGKIPFHPGAVRYFKEKKVWTDAMEKRQATMLNKK